MGDAGGLFSSPGSAAPNANCTSTLSQSAREQTLLLQQAALYTHFGILVAALCFFHAVAGYRGWRIINRQNYTVIALRLGRELLENTLMWAALLNISVIAHADVGVYILMTLIPLAVIAVHAQAVLSFHRKINIFDDRIESYDVALCFHFHSYFAGKSWIARFVIIASVPALTIVALISGTVSGRNTDFAYSASECTASFLLAFFSSFQLLKPAMIQVGTPVSNWSYERYQRALLRRTMAERAMAELRPVDRYRCPQALARSGSSIATHVRYLISMRSTLICSAREVVYRESTHLAYADHRNEKVLSSDALAALTKMSVGAIERKLHSKAPKQQQRQLGPGWCTMNGLLRPANSGKAVACSAGEAGAAPAASPPTEAGAAPTASPPTGPGAAPAPSPSIASTLTAPPTASPGLHSAGQMKGAKKPTDPLPETHTITIVSSTTSGSLHA